MELRGRLRRATVLGSVVGLTSLAGAGLVPTPARAAVHPTLALVGLAGDGQSAFAGDGGPASAAHLNGPRGVAVAADGDVFIADSDNNRIRRGTPSGMISTVAGTGDAGFSGDGGPALAAHLSRPFGVAVDPSGTLFIADTDNNRIRKVSPDGVISTIAGTGVAAFSGDNGPGVDAQLNSPRGLAVDPAGHVVIADSVNNRVRRLDGAGTITTIAGTGTAGFSGDGGPAVDAMINYPRSIAFDPAGRLVFVDTRNARVRRVDGSGVISTIVGDGVGGFGGDGGPATAAHLNVPYGVAYDRAGVLYIADSSNYRVRAVEPSGTISTVAGTGAEALSGDGGPATLAPVDYPIAVATDRAGGVDVAVRDSGRVVRLVPLGPGGYWMVARDGGVFAFGDAPFAGSAAGIPLSSPVVGLARTPTGNGYWLAAADGGVFAFGDARFFGSMGGTRLSRPIVGMAATPTGDGYWLVASDGGVFAFGDARFKGSTGAMRLAQPVVGMAATPTGDGYWLVASDGGVFAFGTGFFGSTGAIHLAQPVVGMAAAPTGDGYWLVARDGGVFAFGGAGFFGSTGATRLVAPAVGLAPSPTGHGYRLIAADGGVFAFGDATFFGSTGAMTLRQPVTGGASAALARP